MASLLPLLMLLIFGACVAFLFRDGMWNNGLRLINVVTAALLAMNFWEPVAGLLEGFGGFLASMTFFLDFLALWGVFCLSLIVLRVLTDTASRVKVRFSSLADRIGGAVLAVWIGWMMVCFTATSLHLAPLERNFLFGGFNPEKRMLLLGPDRQWLGFTQKVSRGQFSRAASEEEVRKEQYATSPDSGEQALCVFDRKAAFIPKYASRRSSLESYLSEKKTFKVLSTDLGSRIPKR